MNPSTLEQLQHDYTAAKTSAEAKRREHDAVDAGIARAHRDREHLSDIVLPKLVQAWEDSLLTEGQDQAKAEMNAARGELTELAHLGAALERKKLTLPRVPEFLPEESGALALLLTKASEMELNLLDPKTVATLHAAYALRGSNMLVADWPSWLASVFPALGETTSKQACLADALARHKVSL